MSKINPSDMLDDFITQTLAHIDDFAELKVSLVALHWLAQKQSATAALTLDELASHPALRNGLGSTPTLTLEYAVRKAIARGTLLTTASASEGDLKAAKLFVNNAPSRELIEVIRQQPTMVGEGADGGDVDVVEDEAFPADEAHAALAAETVQLHVPQCRTGNGLFQDSRKPRRRTRHPGRTLRFQKSAPAVRRQGSAWSCSRVR